VVAHLGKKEPACSVVPFPPGNARPYMLSISSNDGCCICHGFSRVKAASPFHATSPALRAHGSSAASSFRSLDLFEKGMHPLSFISGASSPLPTREIAIRMAGDMSRRLLAHKAEELSRGWKGACQCADISKDQAFEMSLN
jgi:hypothetical protein